MNAITKENFVSLLRQVHVKPRLARELRFVPEEVQDWENREVLAVTNRSGSEGLLLIDLGRFYVLPFTMSRGIANKQTGRATPITCDFCYTWQRGGSAGSITFTRAEDGHTFTFLCCKDLNCSLHVRDKTAAAVLSRTQLHEDITVGQRVERMRKKLAGVVATLKTTPINKP